MATVYNLYINQLGQKDRQYPADGKHAYNLHYWGTRITEDVNALLGSSSLSGAGIVPSTHSICLFTSTGATQRVCVNPGCPQFKKVRIVHIVDGGSGVIAITGTNSTPLTAGVNSITLTNAFDWVELLWNFTTSKWDIIGYGGATIA